MVLITGANASRVRPGGAYGKTLPPGPSSAQGGTIIARKSLPGRCGCRSRSGPRHRCRGWSRRGSPRWCRCRVHHRSVPARTCTGIARTPMAKSSKQSVTTAATRIARRLTDRRRIACWRTCRDTGPARCATHRLWRTTGVPRPAHGEQQNETMHLWSPQK